jgi:serine/threonine protein phosphatase PrpC
MENNNQNIKNNNELNYNSLVYKKEAIETVLDILNSINIEGMANCKNLLSAYTILNSQAKPIQYGDCKCQCCLDKEKEKDGICECKNYTESK